MKLKSIVTAMLLLFVAASIAYVAIKEARADPQPNTPASAPTASASDPEVLNSPGLPGKVEPTKVVVYYFYGNVRCKTCRTIEMQAEEAIRTGFADALKDGRLEWRILNVEESSNTHFIEEFEISTRSIVLERLVDGKRETWKNLDRVWELVRGDKVTFQKYIQDETRAFLETDAK